MMICGFTLADVGRMVDGVPGWSAQSDINLVAHPRIFRHAFKLFCWPHENSNLISASQLPKGISWIFIPIGKGKFVFHTLPEFPKRCFQITVFVPDQGRGDHSGVDSGKLARPRLFLGRRPSKKIILNSLNRKYLCVVEVPDHPVMLEILEQKSQPLRGIRAHAKIDDPIVDCGVNLYIISFRLVGDRLPRSTSPIFGNFILHSPDVNDFIASPSPLFFFNTAIDLWRLSLARDEIGIELQVGQALVL
jgi:hypothetical protein